jgi:hypothetical protein
MLDFWYFTLVSPGHISGPGPSMGHRLAFFFSPPFRRGQETRFFDHTFANFFRYRYELRRVTLLITVRKQ